MDVLRTAVSALAAFDPDTADNSKEATLRKGIRLTAQAPTIVAAHDRIRQGKEAVEPNPQLGHAANFLYMLFGKEPDPEEAKLIDLDFVLHAEHGSNASAFAARVTASTLADLHCAVTSGVATLKGPWHGGAAEAVMKMALEIGTPERASDYARGLLESGGRIMGFGHRVYRAEDPRARHMRDRSKWLAERKGEPRWYQILEELEKAMQPYAAKGICVNVDFYAGSVYYLLGVAEDLFIPIFAMGRVPGWTLQVMEQFADNILLRPLTEYVGPMDVPYVPLKDRQLVSGVWDLAGPGQRRLHCRHSGGAAGWLRQGLRFRSLSDMAEQIRRQEVSPVEVTRCGAGTTRTPEPTPECRLSATCASKRWKRRNAPSTTWSLASLAALYTASAPGRWRRAPCRLSARQPRRRSVVEPRDPGDTTDEKSSCTNLPSRYAASFASRARPDHLLRARQPIRPRQHDRRLR